MPGPSIDSSEREVVGQWVADGTTIVADETCARIVRLTRDYLLRISRDGSGWDTLFRDPSDGRYWLLTYPQSHLQGGGPPALFALSDDDARERLSAAGRS